jgi:hypothetical protein
MNGHLRNGRWWYRCEGVPYEKIYGSAGGFQERAEHCEPRAQLGLG